MLLNWTRLHGVVPFQAQEQIYFCLYPLLAHHHSLYCPALNVEGTNQCITSVMMFDWRSLPAGIAVNVFQNGLKQLI